MADGCEGNGGSERKDEEYDRGGTRDEFGKRPRHVSYHDIILGAMGMSGVSTRVGSSK